MIFSSILKSDREQAALGLADEGRARSRSYWDPGNRIAGALARPLGIERGVAWDVYLVYGPEQRWGSPAPAPVDWAHQLSGGPETRFRPGRIEPWLRTAVAACVDGEVAPVAVQEVGPGSGKRELITISRDDIRPLAELILEDVLRSGVGDLSAEDRQRILGDFSERLGEYGDRVPRAVRLPDGSLPIVPEPSCAPSGGE